MHHTFEDLVAVMAKLRAADGCPWDREQTHASLAPYLIEESHDRDGPDRESRCTGALRRMATVGVQQHRPGQHLSPEAFPGLSLAGDEVLG